MTAAKRKRCAFHVVCGNAAVRTVKHTNLGDIGVCLLCEQELRLYRFIVEEEAPK